LPLAARDRKREKRFRNKAPSQYFCVAWPCV
jgi:hypothetical protein